MSEDTHSNTMCSSFSHTTMYFHSHIML